eukprot:scaffold98791_cov43-Phaeocystis_antarctica.AAC.1
MASGMVPYSRFCCSSSVSRAIQPCSAACLSILSEPSESGSGPVSRLSLRSRTSSDWSRPSESGSSAMRRLRPSLS